MDCWSNKYLRDSRCKQGNQELARSPGYRRAFLLLHSLVLFGDSSQVHCVPLMVLLHLRDRDEAGESKTETKNLSEKLLEISETVIPPEFNIILPACCSKGCTWRGLEARREGECTSHAALEGV